MKKAISILLALVVAVASMFILSVCVFADEEPAAETPVVQKVKSNREVEKEEEASEKAAVEAAAKAAAEKAAAEKAAAEASKADTPAESATEASTEATTAVTTTAPTTAFIAKEVNPDIFNANPNINELVTNPEGVTAINDGDAEAADDNAGDSAGAKSNSSNVKRKPAANTGKIPSTGSAAIVPAVAVLTLMAGTVAVVKTKKEF